MGVKMFQYRDTMIIDVDGFPIKVKQGCDTKDSEFSILYWDPIVETPID